MVLTWHVSLSFLQAIEFNVVASSLTIQILFGKMLLSPTQTSSIRTGMMVFPFFEFQKGNTAKEKSASNKLAVASPTLNESKVLVT